MRFKISMVTTRVDKLSDSERSSSMNKYYPIIGHQSNFFKIASCFSSRLLFYFSVCLREDTGPRSDSSDLHAVSSNGIHQRHLAFIETFAPVCVLQDERREGRVACVSDTITPSQQWCQPPTGRLPSDVMDGDGGR